VNHFTFGHEAVDQFDQQSCCLSALGLGASAWRDNVYNPRGLAFGSAFAFDAPAVRRSSKQHKVNSLWLTEQRQVRSRKRGCEACFVVAKAFETSIAA